MIRWAEGNSVGDWFRKSNCFGMFNDVDGTNAETDGINYNDPTSNSYNFYSSEEDQEILSSHVYVPSVAEQNESLN